MNKKERMLLKGEIKRLLKNVPNQKLYLLIKFLENWI